MHLLSLPCDPVLFIPCQVPRRRHLLASRRYRQSRFERVFLVQMTPLEWLPISCLRSVLLRSTSADCVSRPGAFRGLSAWLLYLTGTPSAHSVGGFFPAGDALLIWFCRSAIDWGFRSVRDPVPDVFGFEERTLHYCSASTQSSPPAVIDGHPPVPSKSWLLADIPPIEFHAVRPWCSRRSLASPTCPLSASCDYVATRMQASPVVHSLAALFFFAPLNPPCPQRYVDAFLVTGAGLIVVLAAVDAAIVGVL